MRRGVAVLFGLAVLSLGVSENLGNFKGTSTA